MVFDITNADLINSKEVIFHDDMILDDVTFNRDPDISELVINCKRCGGWDCKMFDDEFGKWPYNYKIIFQGVLGFDFSNMYAFGKTSYIFGINYLKNEECILLPKLLKKKTDLWEGNEDNYIEIYIETNGADEITVVCERMIIEKIS